MLIIWLTLSWIFLSSAQKVYVPYNCCINYFKYDLVDNGSAYMGIFTPPSGSNSLYKWSATFDIHGHSAVSWFLVNSNPFRFIYIYIYII